MGTKCSSCFKQPSQQQPSNQESRQNERFQHQNPILWGTTVITVLWSVCVFCPQLYLRLFVFAKHVRNIFVKGIEQLAKFFTGDIDEFPLHGISIRGFQNFIESCGGEYAVRNMTCTQVKDQYVLEKTASERMSYCRIIEESERGLARSEATVGKATIFLSFAYNSDFLSVFRCLQNHMRAKVEDFEHQYVWISFFSVNQHSAGEKSTDFWSGTFMTSIKEIGRVVLVALPFNKPAPLTRAWCLWEVYCAVKTNSVFEVAIDKDDEKSFLIDMYENGMSFFKMLENIDMRNSDAVKPQDKVAIHDAVQREVGFDEVNKLIYKPLREWTVGCLDHLYAATQPRLSAMLEIMDAVSMISGETGCVDAIVKLVNQASKEDLLIMMSGLGTAYNDLGMHNKALEIRERTLAMSRHILPADHLDIAMSMGNLANTYIHLLMHDKAMEMHEDALAMRRRILPAEHPSIAKSMNNLANTYSRLGMHNKALEMHESTLAMRRRILPVEHPSIIESMNNLALTYSRLGMHDKALEIRESTLAMRRRILPAEHPLIASSMCNLAVTYSSLGMHDKALKMEESTLAIRRLILPAEHPLIASSMGNLALTYSALGMHKKALEMQESALVMYRRILPADHPDIAMAMNNLALTYSALEMRKGGEALARCQVYEKVRAGRG